MQTEMTSARQSARHVVITPSAAALLHELKERYGPLLFHQSGGCCDGSVPLCLRQSEFRIGARDMLLDTVDGVPFYVDEMLFQYLRDEQTTLDAIPAISDELLSGIGRGHAVYLAKYPQRLRARNYTAAGNERQCQTVRDLHMPAHDESLKNRLSRYREIRITVTGRKSGRAISIPVWFVAEDDQLYLVPVQGSDTQWYKNVLKNPKMRVDARGVEEELHVVPMNDPASVSAIVEKFREKYGSGDVKKYYSKYDVAVVAALQ